ncbi:MAG TPA: ATP-binding protein [Candidatus Dormibacteraeota bacterium]|nr:ATP-binding protein [Candidatus Dormibacteraeota bacterium]
MGDHQSKPFEFHADLTGLDEALQTLHRSIELLRVAAGPSIDEDAVMRFETALGEIGANVLTHGRRGAGEDPIAYSLRLEGRKAHASFVDRGPAVRDQLARAMPDAESEQGRGLAMARALLDELGYRREGDVNTWRLVKEL